MPRFEEVDGDATTFSHADQGRQRCSTAIEAEVVVVDAAGTHGRLRDADGATAGGRASPGGRCAPSPRVYVPGRHRRGGVSCAVSAGPALLGVTAERHPVRGARRPLEGFCAKPATMDPCLVGTWTGQGVQLSLPSVAISGFGGKGAVLRFAKDGTGSVDLDPSAAVVATLPGDLVGSFRMSGQAGGVVHATKGDDDARHLDQQPEDDRRPPLLTNQGCRSAAGAPLRRVVRVRGATLVYSAPGFGGTSTWTGRPVGTDDHRDPLGG
jgi:hypothetical protein